MQQDQCSRTANTCANLLKMWPDLWLFLRNPLVRSANNDAELALRDYVIKHKLSYCTRSKRGMDGVHRAHLLNGADLQDAGSGGL